MGRSEFVEGSDEGDSAGVLNGLLQALNRALEIRIRKEQGLMLHPPHRLKGGRVASEPGDYVPVDVGELVAEEFIIDLLRIEDLSQSLCHEIDLFHQLNPLRGSQMKQFCRVAFEQDDGPSWEELIVVQIGLGKAQIGDEMVCLRPTPLTGLAGRVVHGWLALRHSSSVTTPFLINN